MSKLESAPTGRILGTWNGRHHVYALALDDNAARAVWCRFGTLGWQRLGHLRITPAAPVLDRVQSWEGHTLPDPSGEIARAAARADTGR